jgi:hypothetical protein
MCESTRTQVLNRGYHKVVHGHPNNLNWCFPGDILPMDGQVVFVLNGYVSHHNRVLVETFDLLKNDGYLPYTSLRPADPGDYAWIGEV